MIIKGLCILLIVGSVGLCKSYAADQVKCTEAPSEIEILKLLSFVKNNVLGTVPKFCREKGADQLADQVNDDEKDLNDFVRNLKVIDSNEKNIVKLKKNELDENILQVAKFIILKKILANLDDDIRYEVLLSDECAPFGLNRFPIHESGKKNKADSPKILIKTTKVCDAEQLEGLAPYLTKDILAETLFNLRRIFPEDFPEMVGSLCEGIKKTDEALLKDVEYKNFLEQEGKIAEVESFSSWLKNLYANTKKTSERKIIPKLKLDNVPESVKLLKKEFSQKQENLKLVYETKGEIPEGKENEDVKALVAIIKNYGDVIEKNPNGIYIMKKGPNREKTKTLLEVREKYFQDTFNNGQALGEKEVPLNKQDSYYLISKDENGKIQLKIDEKIKSEILEKAEMSKKSSDKNFEKSFSNPVLQAELKEIFDQQELLAGDEFVRERVIKTSDGFYREITEDFSKGRKYYSDAVAKFNQDIIPGPSIGEFYTKINDDIVLLTYSPMIYAIEKENAESLKKAQGSTLHQELKAYYQGQTSDFDKIKDLPPEKVKSVKNYTANTYHPINTCLRNNNCSESLKKEADNILDVMGKIKINNKDSQVFYRGIHYIPPSVRDALDKNPQSFVMDKAFMSASADVNVAKTFSGQVSSGALLIIKSSRCIGISKMSESEGEDEFLCPPGMKFNVKKQSPDKNVYILEEVTQK